MRAAAPFFHLAPDAACDVVAGKQLRRAPRALVALRVAPAFIGVVGGRAPVILRDIVEHEPLPVFVFQNAALATDAFGNQNAAHARRPDHPRRMELDELHVQQRRSRIERERMAIGRVLPTVRCDLIHAADAARRKHHGFRLEEAESTALAVVAEGAGDAVAVFEQRQDRGFHQEVDPFMNAVILERPDHFQAGAVADVRQARVAVPAEIALENLAVASAVEYRAPGFEFSYAFRGFFGVDFGHSPVVHVLPAAHGIGEMNAPAVAIVHVAHRGGHAAFGHHGVRLAEQALGDDTDLYSRGGGLNCGAQARTSRAHHQHVELVRLDTPPFKRFSSRARFPCRTSAHTNPQSPHRTC